MNNQTYNFTNIIYGKGVSNSELNLRVIYILLLKN